MAMTTDLPFLSIITVTLDNLGGLLKTKASIDAQSCRDYDWIVVDGVSEDGTAYLFPTLNATILSEKDHGIYDAMNKGIGLARGRYVIFMNAGDCFSDADIIAAIKCAATLDAADLIYGDALESNGLYKKARPASRLVLGMPTHHQAMIYRKDAIKTLYSLGYTIASDYDFTVNFLASALKTHYMPCAIFLFEDGGLSQRRRTLGRKEQYKIRKAHALCSPLANAAIYLAQSGSAFLREKYPAFYFKLRSLS